MAAGVVWGNKEEMEGGRQSCQWFLNNQANTGCSLHYQHNFGVKQQKVHQ